MNIAEDIFKRADPRSTAILHAAATTTYHDLDLKSAAFAEALRPHLLGRPHPRVGLSHPDSADYIAMALGIVRAGGCLVPVAPELSMQERAQLIHEIALDALVTTDKAGSVAIASLPTPDVPPDWLARLAEVAPAFIRFTSGTTGESKGIVLSHQTLVERITAANARLGIGPADRVLWVLPMSHHFAVSIMLYLWHGAAIVLPTSHLAGDILQAAKSNHASVIYAAPFHFELLAATDDGTWPDLRLAVSTTAALPRATAEKFSRTFNVFPAQGLGIIEVGLPCLNIPAPEARPDSIGRPQPAFEVEVRPPLNQLYIRGPGFLDAYLSPWKARADILDADGWFATGDIAETDAEGFVTLRGRSRAVIGVGGMKFFPEEVERVLASHPSIRAARVSGRPHPDFGMVPIAEVVVDPDASRPAPVELMGLCRRQLSRYKVPAEIRFVEKIPLTPSGKIKRT